MSSRRCCVWLVVSFSGVISSLRLRCGDHTEPDWLIDDDGDSATSLPVCGAYYDLKRVGPAYTHRQKHSYAESWCHAGKQPSAVGTVDERKQRSLSLSHSLCPTAVLANKARSPPLPRQSSRCLPLWPSFCIWLCVLLRAMCSLPGARLCACVSALSLFA